MPGTTTVYAHALVHTDSPPASLNVQWAQTPLLPRADRQTEVVALVPAGALSWHRVTLPAGLHKQASRLQAALQGLLEDALLDDPAQLHLALQAQWKNTEQPWVAAMGHRVFATAGSDDKARICEQLGAARGINYKSEDFAAVVKQLTDGKGVDVILDMVGGDYLPREIGCLADDGRIAVIALLGGAKATLDLGQVLRRHLTVTGSTLRPRPVEFKARIAAQLRARVWPLLESGAIKPVIHQVFPLEQAAAAHALMESSTHVGKIMLEV
eukprot:gene29568-36638_t